MRLPRALALPTAGALLVLVVALLARSGAPAVQSAQPGTGAALASRHVQVAIRNFAFSPQRLTVRVGTRVTWTNDDATAHTATANNNTSFDTGTINPHQSRTVRFTRTGTYPYHCGFHAFMTGTITVVG